MGAGGGGIYEMRCLFVAVGLNARFIVLPHWDNMLLAKVVRQPVQYMFTQSNFVPVKPNTQSMTVGNDCGTSRPHFLDFTTSKTVIYITTAPIFGLFS